MEINDTDPAARPLGWMVMQTLSDRVRHLELIHGGLRAAARATGIDVAYFKRMRDGEMDNPSTETLDKLGLKKEVVYVLK